MSEPLSSLITEFTESVAVIRFNRPATRNSLTVTTLNELRTSFSTIAADSKVETIIFTGTDDVFASGADIRELTTLNPSSALQFSKSGQQLFQTIADARQTTIAAINGYCMGGALDLALACDIRIASAHAVFAHPGARLGIITGWGGTQRLPRLIGKARALEFFATARRLSSQEALEFGLVNDICDPVLECAVNTARDTSHKAKAPNLTSAPL
ncbi:MAG: enoyl-CoA hydratase/isomerase family protein [Pyrinomonadaceae bacterium]|nr:enoyl-CoA hydratase/isomerase family protein [Pyrinomonadaceae bacterium]